MAHHDPREEAPDVSIIGLGASGYAAARLALKQGERTHVSDLGTDPATRARAGELVELGAHVELGHHDLARIAQARTLVVSPGIPPDAPVLRELRARGVRWIGEPEFAVRFLPASLIAVTGTNGKTTTTLLAAHLLREGGVDAAAAGNVGGGLAPAASELALRPVPPRWAVLEMSSFQLADTDRFAPEIGVVTSLAPDHLDRYPDVEAYYADKARLFRNARPTDRWILNGESDEVRDLPGDAGGVRLLFAADPEAGAGSRRPGEAGTAAFLDGDVLALRIPEEAGGTGALERLVPAHALPILGAHNVRNALAAALAARLAGAAPEGIRRGLRSFRGLPHRMERIAEEAGVLWINDSKATNVAAAAAALASLDRPVVALVGGKDKGEDFRPLAAALAGGARAAILFGAAAPRLEAELQEALEGHPDAPTLHRTAGLDEAVALARRAARPGDAVLLAPACSSFDAFTDFAARGARFAQLVRSEASRTGSTRGAPDPDRAP
jgi:UDP-N-acetylmuramoylalanine--D-glutamate ligase